jgi:hypothetical protein
MPNRIKSILKDVEILIPRILLVMMEGNQGFLQIPVDPFHFGWLGVMRRGGNMLDSLLKTAIIKHFGPKYGGIVRYICLRHSILAEYITN